MELLSEAEAATLENINKGKYTQKELLEFILLSMYKLIINTNKLVACHYPSNDSPDNSSERGDCGSNSKNNI